ADHGAASYPGHRTIARRPDSPYACGPESAGGSRMFRLRIEGGPRNGEGISLAPGKTLVCGRGRECDVRFPEDATMSRVQCELTWDGSAWTVVNKSQHGTLVGGARVDTTKVLTPGDQLVLGGTRVVYEADPSGSPTVAPQPSPAAAGAPDANKITDAPAGAK